ncbi:hypothetical protein DFQ27_004974 [Actinomortierella ambigua]|uniref:Peptidase A1 domain-containing protein n=1 Tax=Actinomortierella ambigua TaxID=1343610 RepID=A0A9P6UCH3_9FUNG|nr:hypothetical protein DFQ27_004974 [Actinomortierella ambigua]
MRHLPLILVVAVHVACAGTGIPLVSHKNEAWSLSLSVGDPLVTFTVLVSTGSSDLFLPGSACSTCDRRRRYDSSHSSASVDLGRTFEMSFGDGSKVEGDCFEDTVTIGDLKAEKQAIGVARQYSTNMSPDQFPADGLLGLAFESLSTLKASPLVQTLVSQGQLDASVFSLKLASDDSELFLGGTNDELFTGDITYTSVTEERYWQVTVGSIDVNQESVLSNHGAIIDSGTSRISLSPSDAEVFFSKIPGARPSSEGDGQYAYPCDSLPTVSLTFNGRSFEIAPDKFKSRLESEDSSDCIAVVAGDGRDGEPIVIGTAFLMNVYTVFDIDNTQVGFASLA